MSKSYKRKVRCFICTGSNTEWYRWRNKNNRVKNKHQLNNLLKNYEAEDVDDKFTPIIVPREDHWSEPTDGHYTMSRRLLELDLELAKDQNKPDDVEFCKKYLRKLKPKNNAIRNTKR